MKARQHTPCSGMKIAAPFALVVVISKNGREQRLRWTRQLTTCCNLGIHLCFTVATAGGGAVKLGAGSASGFRPFSASNRRAVCSIRPPVQLCQSLWPSPARCTSAGAGFWALLPGRQSHWAVAPVHPSAWWVTAIHRSRACRGSCQAPMAPRSFGALARAEMPHRKTSRAPTAKTRDVISNKSQIYLHAMYRYTKGSLLI